MPALSGRGRLEYKSTDCKASRCRQVIYVNSNHDYSERLNKHNIPKTFQKEQRIVMCIPVIKHPFSFNNQRERKGEMNELFQVLKYKYDTVILQNTVWRRAKYEMNQHGIDKRRYQAV